MNDLTGLFWQAYLVNFIFWVGLAQGAVILVAALNMTGARWGDNYVRIARGFSGFLPISVALFGVLLLGRNHIFPWIAEPIPEKAAYLNVQFLAARGIIGLTLLAILSKMCLSRAESFHKKLESDESPPGASGWSVALAMVFMVVYSYLAFDLIMSLQPHWHSTLLGAHYAIGCFYLGIAGLILVGSRGEDTPVEGGRKLTLLMFGLAPFWISLLWSQYIVIWYGDIPAETQFIYLRFYQTPWMHVTFAMLALAFVVPFVILLPRRAKQSRALQGLAALSAIVGLMLEKCVMVMPSLSPEKISIGFIFALVTVAFAALFVIVYKFSSRRTG